MSIKEIQPEKIDIDKPEENPDKLVKVADRINESIIELKKLSIVHFQLMQRRKSIIGTISISIMSVTTLIAFMTIMAQVGKICFDYFYLHEKIILKLK